MAASTVTYNCVLDACANGGNPQRAAELFQEMNDRKASTSMYSQLLYVVPRILRSTLTPPTPTHPVNNRWASTKSPTAP